MFCQNCKKREATVHHVESINGKPCEMHLCAMCANEMFGGFEQEVENAVLNGLFGAPLQEEKVCPACGLSFSQYKQTGLLGCPSCYDVFNEELLPYIKSIHGETVHVGKGGGVYTGEHDLRIKLASLQEAMEEAMLRGDFAKANAINEQMSAEKEHYVLMKIKTLQKAIETAKLRRDFAEVGRLREQVQALKESKSGGWKW